MAFDYAEHRERKDRELRDRYPIGFATEVDGKTVYVMLAPEPETMQLGRHCEIRFIELRGLIVPAVGPPGRVLQIRQTTPWGETIEVNLAIERWDPGCNTDVRSVGEFHYQSGLQRGGQEPAADEPAIVAART